MKKLFSLVLTLVVILSLVGCGGKKANDNATQGSEKSSSQTTDKENDVTYGVKGESVIFEVSLDFTLEDSTAWLGIIPSGKKYEKESDADDVDMIYCYAVNYDEENKKSYRFEFEKEYFFSVGDGTYDMVLTSSDDGEVGKVLLQIGIEIKGNEITLDFENRK